MADEEVPSSGSGDNIKLFDNSKAGLQSVDKEKTERLIKELSKGSSFYTNEERKLQNRKNRVESLLKKDRNVLQAVILKDSAQYHKLKAKVDAMENALEERRAISVPDSVEEIVTRYRHTVNPDEKNRLKIEMEQILRNFKIYVHIDMDMFFAAVEEKYDPKLKGLPFAVGNNAMLSTSNYVARTFGIRAGMPGFIAKKLCPQLLLVDVDFEKYKAESRVFKEVCALYDPSFCSHGLDESLLELSSYLHEHQPALFELSDNALKEGNDFDTVLFPIFEEAETIVEEIRRNIEARTGLTASAGIAVTGTMAKMASNYNKPNGQKSILKEAYTRTLVKHYFAPLRVKEVPGIGKSTEYILNHLGIHTFDEFYQQRYRLGFLFTEKTFLNLFGSAIGICGFFDGAEDQDHSTEMTKKGKELDGIYDTGRKSLGQERTFYKLKSRLELQEVLQDNMEKVQAGMLKENLVCGQIVLKLKHTSFQVKQYSKDVELFPLRHTESNSSDPHQKEYFTFENKFYTDNLELLKANADVLLFPVIEHYAEYRLLGFRVDKLLHKGALLSHLEKCKQPQQQTLQRFFQKKKRFKMERGEEEIYVVSTDDSSSVSSDDDAVEICAPTDPQSTKQYHLVSSETQLSKQNSALSLSPDEKTKEADEVYIIE